jgi:hypothetical protein
MRNDYFRDQTGATPKALDLWEPIVIPKEEIDAEIARLANLPAPANGRRRSVFVHPRNRKSNGLTCSSPANAPWPTGRTRPR